MWSKRCAMFFVVFAVAVNAVSAIVNPHVYDDIALTHQFGCHWYGGSLAITLDCNCENAQEVKEFYIQKKSISAYDTETIKIYNCAQVRFGNSAIKDMRVLRNIELKNIASIVFEEHSLEWNGYVDNANEYNSWESPTPGLNITITNSNIKQISNHAFKGHVKYITIDQVVVEDVAPFAMSSIKQNQKLEVKNSFFRNIQPQAFKTVSTLAFSIENVTFTTLPSRSFSEIEVYDSMSVTWSSFDTIKPGAFLITRPKLFEFVSCKVDLLEGDAFKIETRGNVLFKNNSFNMTYDGSFKGIAPYKEEARKETQTITFKSNTFSHLTKYSLEVDTDSFMVIFDDVLFNGTCDCRDVQYLFSDSIYEQGISCLLEGKEAITINDFKSQRCSVLSSHGTVIIIVGVVLILIVLIATGLVVFYKRVYKGAKQKEYISDKNGKHLGMIMPDGRTYRETELHVIVERTDLLTTDL